MAVDLHCVLRSIALRPPHQHDEHLVDHLVSVVNMTVVYGKCLFILQLSAVRFSENPVGRLYCPVPADPDNADSGIGKRSRNSCNGIVIQRMNHSFLRLLFFCLLSLFLFYKENDPAPGIPFLVKQHNINSAPFFSLNQHRQGACSLPESLFSDIASCLCCYLSVFSFFPSLFREIITCRNGSSPSLLVTTYLSF